MKREPIVLTKTGEAVYTFGIGLSLAVVAFGLIRLFGYLVLWVAGL